MLEGRVEDWMKNILYQFIKDQTHVGMPRGPKMSMALAEPKQVALRSKLNTTSEHTPQVERNYWFPMQNNQQNIIREELSTKSPIQFKETLYSLIYKIMFWNVAAEYKSNPPLIS